MRRAQSEQTRREPIRRLLGALGEPGEGRAVERDRPQVRTACAQQCDGVERLLHAGLGLGHEQHHRLAGHERRADAREHARVRGAAVAVDHRERLERVAEVLRARARPRVDVAHRHRARDAEGYAVRDRVTRDRCRDADRDLDRRVATAPDVRLAREVEREAQTGRRRRLELLDHQLVRARAGRPVDVARVVAAAVLAQAAELGRARRLGQQQPAAMDQARRAAQRQRRDREELRVDDERVLRIGSPLTRFREPERKRRRQLDRTEAVLAALVAAHLDVERARRTTGQMADDREHRLARAVVAARRRDERQTIHHLDREARQAPPVGERDAKAHDLALGRSRRTATLDVELAHQPVRPQDAHEQRRGQQRGDRPQHRLAATERTDVGRHGETGQHQRRSVAHEPAEQRVEIEARTAIGPGVVRDGLHTGGRVAARISPSTAADVRPFAAACGCAISRCARTGITQALTVSGVT
jgi:hypothetical protein